MGFLREEYWSGLPFPPSEDLRYPGIELESFASPALAGWFSFYSQQSFDVQTTALCCRTSMQPGSSLASSEQFS